MSAEAALKLKAEGNAFLKAKNFDGAIEKYTEAIALDPTNHVFFSNRSAAYLSKGEGEKALADGEQCVSLKPDWTKGYGRKGAALHKLKRYAESMEAYEAGLKVSPNDAALQRGLRDAQAGFQSSTMPQGNPLGQLFNDQSIARLKAHPDTGPLFADGQFEPLLRAAASNPNGLQMLQSDPRLMTCLQVLLGGSPAAQRAQQEARDEQQRKEEAEVRATPKGYGSWAPKAKEPEPEEEEELTAEQLAEKEQKEAEEAAAKERRAQADVKKDEGNALYKNKDFEAAIAKYNEAIEIDNTNSTYLNNIAAVQMAQKNYDGALETCAKALEVAKSNRAGYEAISKIHVRKATCYMKRKDFDSAITAYEDALMEFGSKDVEKKLKKAQRLKKKAEEAAYINPEIAQEHKEKGNTLFKAGKFPEALKEYSEAIKRDPSNKFLYQNRATAYSKLMVFDAALRDCEQALKIDPEFVKAHARSGFCYKGLAKLHKAMESFQRGLQLSPNDPQCLKGLRETQAQINKNMTEGASEEQRQRALEDPEIRQIFSDPMVRSTLEAMSKDPAAAEKAMANPGMREKINKLMAAGLLSFGNPNAQQGGGQK